MAVQTGLLSKSCPLLSILMHFFLYYLYVFMFCLSNLPFTISLATKWVCEVAKKHLPWVRVAMLKAFRIQYRGISGNKIGILSFPNSDTSQENFPLFLYLLGFTFCMNSSLVFSWAVNFQRLPKFPLDFCLAVLPSNQGRNFKLV